MFKKLFIINLMILFFIIFAFSQEKNVKTYGEKITLKKITHFGDIMRNPGKFKNKDLVIEAEVGAVCQHKGCWMEVTDGKDKIRVQFKDYSFFVPYDSKGKKVRLQGKVERREIKAETYKHWLEEAGEPADKIAKISGPQKVLIFTATGVEMEGGSDLTPEQLEKIQSKSDSHH